MYEKVIIPTDGSDCAENGVDEGLEMTRTLGVEAVAVYVIDTSEYQGLHHSSIKTSARSGLKHAGEKALETVEEKAKKKGVELTKKIVEGKPYEEICNTAGENDVIYISSHGLSGFTQLFMGSTTQKVIKHSHATVSVVMGHFTEMEGEEKSNG